MAFRYYHIFMIIFTAIPICSNGQQSNEYRLEYGFSSGYRSFNLDEVNQRINYLNPPETIKPDHGSAVFSADIKGHPVKSKPFFLNFRVDFLPVDTRNYVQKVLEPPTIIQPPTGPADTVYSYEKISSAIQTTMYFGSFQIGTDIAIGRFSAGVSCGAVYSALIMNQLQMQQVYSKGYQNKYYLVQNDASRTIYETKNNFGFIASGTVSYPLLSRLSADFSFSAIVLNPEITFNHGNSFVVPDGYFGIKGFGIYYPRELTAALSGVQLTAGLSFILF